MLRKLRAKWCLLAAGVGILPIALGQCVADIIEDAIVFTIVD